MSAYSELKAFAQRGEPIGPGGDTSEAWQIRGMDIATARPAAVLVLFGHLDDMPARIHSPAVPDDLDVLFVTRAGTLRNHPGQVAFPGGRIDDDDAGPVAAALREAEEETGLDPAGVEILGPLPEVGLPVSNYLVTPVLAWWSSPTPVRVVDHAESSHVFRAPVAELLSAEVRFTAVVRHKGREHRTPAFTIDGITIWGFTGLLLSRLFDGLGWTQPWDESREQDAPIGRDRV
ncbi:NUDIX domain-containing protein [Arthrobacter subterraneus]|uniref:NUDIX domain-containing protein n=1 Tax=Arthrobacter subterraneus TaxID=335973 RepID=A0A1G8D7T9_9MICC|nr:CoA pyrophosphatase [Arthrobacter subterraneus]SDH53761.1 NUDIX domain-containing protein [Arthrobacter subterraneus]